MLDLSLTWKKFLAVSAINPAEREIENTKRKNNKNKTTNTQLSVCGSEGCCMPTNPCGTII
jgi:hypothetical protein